MKKFLGRIATAALCIPAAFGLFSCLSTESVTEPVEPALVVENAALPDGTVVSVQLFATATEVQAWWKQLHPEKLHAKYELTDRNSTAAQSMQSIWAKSTDSNGYFKNEYSAADFGELATIMQENGLRYGRGELFIGTELRSIYFSADKKYKKFFFLRVDYLDEEGVKKLQAIEEEEKAAREALSKEIANASASTISTNQQADWIWYPADIGHRTNSSFGTKEYESGFYYRVVYNDGTYCYCIDKNRNWYLRNSSGKLIRIDVANVPAKVRALAE